MKVILTSPKVQLINFAALLKKRNRANRMSDEWDVFGSDDDESVGGEEDNQVGNTTNDPEIDPLLKSSFEQTADEITQFTTQRFIKSNRSIMLNDRYFGSYASDCDGNDSGIKRPMELFHDFVSKRIQQRGIQMEEIAPSSFPHSKSVLDAASLAQNFGDSPQRTEEDIDVGSWIRKKLVPGGFLIITTVLSETNVITQTPLSLLEMWTQANGSKMFSASVWDIEHSNIIFHDKSTNIYTMFLQKRSSTVNTLSCKWKSNKKRIPKSFQDESPAFDETWIDYERRILDAATVALSAYEQKEGILTKDNIEWAAKALQAHGFVIIPNLFKSKNQVDSIKAWSASFLKDFDSAAEILFEENNVDILNPGEGSDPLSYRELAMREDFRLDIRDGPCIRSSRDAEKSLNEKVLNDLGYNCLDGGEGTTPSIIDRVKDESQLGGPRNTDSLRFNPFVLDIVRKVLNPHIEHDSNDKKEPLFFGNFGRWNFSGSGPTGQPQPVRVSQIGSVISLPGAADQCIHADTPHLFETEDCLPCHYANLFIYGDGGVPQSKACDADGNFTGENEVGGTAFINESHRLSVTARMTADDGISAAGNKEGTQNEMHMRIIRPSLELGDAVIFDTRTLHFGLANQAKSRRPMLYVNMMHSWFFDPKNWDMKKSIFEMN